MPDSKHMLDDNRITRLLIKLSAPATVGMLVMALYNVVDTIFVGRGVGTNALAGLAICFPYFMISMGLSMVLGIGGGSLVSRSLGAKDIETAERTVGTAFTTIVLVSVVLAGLSRLFLPQLLSLLGAGPDIAPSAAEYLAIILIGVPFQGINMVGNNLARSEGKAHIAMTTMLVSALLNVALDALFIIGFDWGIAGAAWATVISQVAATIWILAFFIRGKGSVKLHRRYLRVHLSILGQVGLVGMSSFARQVAGSVIFIFINNLLARYDGSLAIAAFGVVNRLMSMIFMPILGIGQGLQPIAGFNYGAHQFGRARAAIRTAIIWASAIAVLGSSFCWIFPEFLMKIFTEDQELIKSGAGIMKIIMLGFPIVGFQIIGSVMFQAFGQAGRAFILTISRQILLLLPLLYILPLFFGKSGILAAFPVSDILSALITAVYVFKELKHLHVRQGEKDAVLA